jgi:hypothetical protein
MFELTLGRNSPSGAWEDPAPLDLSPSNLDWNTWLKDTPKIPFNPERFARWRCRREYGTRVAGVLNGKAVIDNIEIPGITGGALDSQEGMPGPIYLQGSEKGHVSFRDIAITPAE